jgi:hypothetical protein
MSWCVQTAGSRVESLGAGQHVGEVCGISGCLRKPLIATTGADRSLRLWNYNDRLIGPLIGPNCV